MKAQKIIARAVRENPDVALVLEISARAREAEQRELPVDFRPATDVAANPVAAQGAVYGSGCVLTDERHLVS